MKKLSRFENTFEEISIIISVNNTKEQKKLKCNKYNKNMKIWKIWHTLSDINYLFCKNMVWINLNSLYLNLVY